MLRFVRKKEDIDDDEAEHVFRFAQDRMVLPAIDLSCCELPELDGVKQETKACDINVVDDNCVDINK